MIASIEILTPTIIAIKFIGWVRGGRSVVRCIVVRLLCVVGVDYLGVCVLN